MSEYTQHTLNNMPYWERQHHNPNPDSPIVVTMHWMTGTAQAMAFIFDEVDFPLREIALQGTHPSGYPEGGFSWFERETDFYDVLSEAEQAPLIRKEADKIANFISALREQYSGKVIVTGMSQGGDLSLHLAAYYPELIDLTCPMAGRLSEPMRPETIVANKLPKVVMLQGADDAIVMPETAQSVETWLRLQNYDISLHVYEDVGHDISPEMINKLHDEIKKL